MNKAYAFFCRAYQTVFRAALPILPYREPVQLDGLASIVPLLTEKEISSVLLVTDASVRALGLTGGLEDALKAASVACAVYDKTVPNPTIANIEEGRALYLSAHAQAIIAVGGGSVMDCAKIIGARIAKPRQPVQRMGGLLRILRRTPLLIAAPTTAGTGSETTLAAVITDSAAHHKYPINDFALIPDYAVLDPELTRGLPPMLTATTGMDALTHAIEAYIGRSTTKLTRAMSEEAATRIVRSLYAAYENGGDMQARADMLNAITLLRVRRMGRDEAFFEGVRLPGGAIAEDKWADAFADPERLPELLRPYGERVMDAELAAVRNFAHLPGLEKAMDNALLAIFTKDRFDVMRLETVVGYLLAVEREAGAVRLVMAGKQNGFDMEAIRERLRDLYG